MAPEFRSVSTADVMVGNPRALTLTCPDDHPPAKDKRPN